MVIFQSYVNVNQRIAFSATIFSSRPVLHTVSAVSAEVKMELAKSNCTATTLLLDQGRESLSMESRKKEVVVYFFLDVNAI